MKLAGCVKIKSEPAGRVGQLLNGFELRVPHPCALCKGAVLAQHKRPSTSEPL